MINLNYLIKIQALKKFNAQLTLIKFCNKKYINILKCSAVIGKNGIGKKIEGDGRTPIGTWKIGNAYGIKNNPNCCIPYTKINNDMYWCSTSSKGERYNTLIYRSHNPDENYSQDEHLIDYPFTYKYFLDIGFNKDKIPYNGSAIFLHCWKTANTPTNGCVAISEKNIIKILQTINKNTIVTIL